MSFIRSLTKKKKAGEENLAGNTPIPSASGSTTNVPVDDIITLSTKDAGLGYVDGQCIAAAISTKKRLEDLTMFTHQR